MPKMKKPAGPTLNSSPRGGEGLQIVSPFSLAALLLASLLLAACGSDDAPSTPGDDTPVTVACAQPSEPLVIADGWRFQTDPDGAGEAAGWASPDFDDAAWDDLAPGAAWENLGVEYDGAAWYRVSLTLPDWEAVYLVLSRVDDSARLWVNGTAAGEWTLSSRQATYVTLTDYAASGEAVTLALRVDDLGGYGGAIDPVRLVPEVGRGLSDEQWITWLAEQHPDWPMPGWTRGQPLAWTLTGGIGLADEALVSADGAVAPWADAPTVEAWLLDSGAPVGANEAVFSLVEGDLPLPQWEWSALGVTLRGTLFYDAEAAAVRWRLEAVANNEAAERPLTLFIVVRPFAANAAAHTVQSVNLNDPARLWLNGQPFMVMGQQPDSVGVGTLAEVMEAAVGPAVIADLPNALDCVPDGDGAAVLAYTFKPREKPRTFHFAFPAAQGGDFPSVKVDIDDALAESVALWRSETGRMTITLPDDRLTASIPASVGYLLLANDPDGPHPGSLAHDSVWTRDAAYTGLALLQSGHAATARGYIAAVFAGQDADGRVAPIQGESIPWEADEWDAQGQAIFLVTSVYRYTGDRALLDQWYPNIRLAAEYLITLRASVQGESGAGANIALAGLLPPSLSAEDLGPHDQHYYWDDLWAVAGLDEAAYAANVLGETADSERYSAEADDLRAAILASVEVVLGPDAPYIPAAVEDLTGSGMARGSVPALWPVRVFAPDLPLLARAFDYYAQTWITPYGGAYRHREGQFWPYAGVDLAHAYLRLGRGDVLHQVLGWTLDHQTLPGTYAWAEQVSPADSGFTGGDLPHAWAAGGWVTLIREMLISENGDRLELFTGAAEWWFEAGRVIALANAPTAFGTLSLDTASDIQVIDGAWQGSLTLTLRLDADAGGAETLGAFVWRVPQLPAAVEGPPGTVMEGDTLVIPAAGTVRLTFGE